MTPRRVVSIGFDSSSLAGTIVTGGMTGALALDAERERLAGVRRHEVAQIAEVADRRRRRARRLDRQDPVSRREAPPPPRAIPGATVPTTGPAVGSPFCPIMSAK